MPNTTILACAATALAGSFWISTPCYADPDTNNTVQPSVQVSQGVRTGDRGPNSQPSTATESSAGETTNRLAEVVVTAQRREESLQDVPISVQVVGGQTLVHENLNTLADLALTVPSVKIIDGGPSNALVIRGIGSGFNQAFEQAAGTFVDDIYHGRSRTTDATFLDVDRIEVLKGPQSTYFGNNAIAGAFSINTRKPGRSFDALMRALYGEFGQYGAEGAVGGPLTDMLAVRVAATFNGMDGWLKNVSNGDHVPNYKNLAGRISLSYTPSEDLEAVLKVEGGDNRNTGAYPFQMVGCPPPPPFVAAGFCQLALGLGQPTGLDANKDARNGGQGIWLNGTESALTVNYRHWDHTFTSVTGWYGYHYRQNWDADGTPLTLLNIQVPENYRQFSQELRIASPAGRTVEYLAGTYLQTDRLQTDQDISLFFLSPVIQTIPPFAGLNPYLPLGQDIHYQQGEHSYSVFGSASWNVTRELKLSAGLRGSWVRKSYDWNLFYGTATQDYGAIAPLPSSVAALPSAFGLGSPTTLRGDRADHAWLPSGKIQYQLRPDAMVYFSYARGFLAGGFNATDNSGLPERLPFAPEYVDAYEVGLKSKWFDSRVLLNLALFRSNYHDLQVSQQVLSGAGTYSALVTNAGSALSRGVELEGAWVVNNHLRLGADVTYLDAHYVSYPNAAPTPLQTLNGLSTQNLSGQRTSYSPKWSGSLRGAYSTNLLHWRFTTELSGLFASSYYQNALDQWTGAYGRLDARLSLESTSGGWAFDVIGKNLTDRNIVVFPGAEATAPGTLEVQKEPPRNVAFQLRYRW
jgi:iron complex outermembrane receptor protein